MNRQAFFNAVRKHPFGGSLKKTQVDGMEAILDAWDKHGDGDSRKLAYILATAKWETAHTMQPIAEFGKGKGRRYGKPDPKTGKTYYGRGFVQLTWKTNYQKAGAKLQLDLVNRPQLAMQEGPAAEIIVRGMMDGWFTGKKLGDYINSDMQDFGHARKIVNGMDKYRQIAAIAIEFQKAINAAEKVKDTPPPDIPKPPKRAPGPPVAERTTIWAFLAKLFASISGKG